MFRSQEFLLLEPVLMQISNGTKERGGRKQEAKSNPLPDTHRQTSLSLSPAPPSREDLMNAKPLTIQFQSERSRFKKLRNPRYHAPPLNLFPRVETHEVVYIRVYHFDVG
jgi:hypothetical protein